LEETVVVATAASYHDGKTERLLETSGRPAPAVRCRVSRRLLPEVLVQRGALRAVEHSFQRPAELRVL
jgi:hypothetical protein